LARLPFVRARQIIVFVLNVSIDGTSSMHCCFDFTAIRYVSVLKKPYVFRALPLFSTQPTRDSRVLCHDAPGLFASQYWAG